jgi:hypothetical protein
MQEEVAQPKQEPRAPSLGIRVPPGQEGVDPEGKEGGGENEEEDGEGGSHGRRFRRRR